LLVISFTLLIKIPAAQNLVSDSSFENWGKFKPSPHGNYTVLNNIEEWKSVNKGTNTPDFTYFKNSNDYDYGFGRQKPHTGNAFVHINFTINNAECVEVKLIEPLLPNHFYKIQLFVSRAEYSAFTYLKAIPAMLTYGKYDMSEKFKDIPILELEPDSGEYALRDTLQWHKCSKIYRAKGGESWLMIGTYRRSFYNGKTLEEPSKKTFLKNSIYPGLSISPSYAIDDVSLIEVDSLGNAIKNDTAVTSTQIINFSNIKTDSTYRLNNILFEFNKSELLFTSLSELDELAEYLKQHRLFKVEVSGHTDNTGSEKGNQKLSEARAKSVSDYLIIKGVQPQRIVYKGYGSTQPLTDNINEESKAKNRRVDFKIMKD
jgi:outer membrane protein OmpA-like peptidoglycan-associated protein